MCINGMIMPMIYATESHCTSGMQRYTGRRESPEWRTQWMLDRNGTGIAWYSS